MSPIIPIAGVALGLLFALGGTANAKAPKGPSSPNAPGAVPSPTSKPIAQRMAEVIASGDPNAIRFEAGRLRQEGYPTQAAELERVATQLEAEIAAGKKPAPVYAVKPPAPSAVSPGWPLPSLPPIVIPSTAPIPSLIPAVPPAAIPSPVVANVAPPVLPAGVILKRTYAKDGKTPTYVQPTSAGPLVQQWQRKLLSLGFSVGTKGADGRFGADTEQATKLFQTASNVAVASGGSGPKLTIDGKVGPQTIARAQIASVRGSGPSFGADSGPPFPIAASPLPGFVPMMQPGTVDPRRALVARVVTMLLTCQPGQEDRSLVQQLQMQEGEKANGFYGPGLAAKIGARYGVIPPKPLYWTRTATGKSKANYRAQLATLAENDPQRAEEWAQAAVV